MPPETTRVQDRVNHPSDTYRAMMKRWELIIDLGGGTLAMREAGEKWLPREPNEAPEKFNIRLSRSVLFNAFDDAVNRIVERPFSKPIKVENLPEQMKFMETDVDGQGTHLHDFANDALDSAVRFGKVHILPDFPALPTRRTLEDDRKLGARPTFTLVPATAVIGWRYEAQLGGPPRLVQLRIRETHSEADGLYGDKEVEYIRVLTPTSWELHRKVDGDTAGQSQFVVVASGPLTLGEIPLVTIYTNRTGFMTAEPPLEDLAWLNLAHWQSSSDQRNILRFARLGILFAKGLSDEDIEQGITISPTNVIATTNEGADLKYVEHSGEAIKAGERDLEQLEQRMETLGSEPLLQRSGTRTATERSINEANSDSAIQAWIRALERGLEQCFGYAARWLKIKLSEDFSVDIYNEFGTAASAQGHIEAITKLWLAGKLTSETALRELKRRDVFGDTLDIEEEAEAIDSQVNVGPNDPDMPPEPDPEDPEDKPNRPRNTPAVAA